MNIIKIIVPLLILFFNNTFSQEIVEFKLSKTDIEGVSYKISTDSTYSIFIKLNVSGTEKLREITKNNVNFLLRIVKANHILQEAIIRGEIRTGLIALNDLMSEKEVLKFIKILLK